MTTRVRLNPPPVKPDALAPEALLDIKDMCALYRAGPSWIYAEVAAGRIPPPVRFSQRCSRWIQGLVHRSLQERIDVAARDTIVSERNVARAVKAAGARKPRGAGAVKQGGAQ